MIARHDSLIVQKISRLLIPFIQMYAFYVLMNGHHSPGGGFQAGVLIGSSIILHFLVGSRKELRAFQLRREITVAILGLLTYTGTGLLAFFGGGLFLDYGKSFFFTSMSEPMRRYSGILWIEIGVTLGVAMTLVIIFHVLALMDPQGNPQKGED